MTRTAAVESQEVNPAEPAGVSAIMIAGKKFLLGECPEQDKQLLQLKKIVEKESGHCQWEKQAINLALLGLLILMNLVLGSSSRKSIIGIQNCSPAYWGIYAGFLMICVLSTGLAIWLAKYEQSLKVKYGNVNIVKSDILLTPKAVTAVVCLGFFGGLISGALGLGGGVIFNPCLLTLGLPPLVSSASGLYLVTFSKIATTVVYLVFGQLDIPYGFWLSFCASVGSVAAIFIARWYEKASGRQSFIVWVLFFDFVLAIGVMTAFGALNLKQSHDSGVSISAFMPLCKK